MAVIQVVIDSKLLRAANQAARRTKRNRSALMRDALREHLYKLHVREAEEREREAYRRKPQDCEELLLWERETRWLHE
jgi:metal-responsive CopG/Arc/MetJ family transcriptional regulator